MKKVQVLQGLNLISPYSTVIIEMNETEEVKKLLDLIKGFHPLFIEKYYFTQGYLYIETKIAFLWREAGEYLQKLAEGKMTYEECREYVVEVIIQHRLKSMSTLPILYSALEQGYEVTPFIVSDKTIAADEVGYTKTFNRRYTLGCGRDSQVTMSISSSKDAIVAKTTQRDKYITNTMIAKLGLPMPKNFIVNTKSDIEEVWGELHKPVVVKPVGLTGGSGVVVDLHTIEDAKKAFDFSTGAIEGKKRKEWQTKIMIQEQVEGEDYRLLVIDGKLEVATKRIPAFIVGDGKSTIQKLIDETNKDPRRDITSPAHTLKPIKIDQPLLDYLKEQKLTLESIPKQDEKIQVRKVASMSQGGITEDFTDQVSDEIKYIVESIATSIHAFTLGVDILCKDLSKPLTQENGAILEINTMPEAYLNLFPVLGEDRSYVADTFVKKILKDNKTKKVVVVGSSLPDILTVLREKNLLGSYFTDNEVVGEYKDGYLRINGLEINSGLEKWKGIEALKVNALLDGIIIHHRDWDAVKSDGLGFNNIDLLVVSKDEAEKEEMKTIRKYRKHIHKIKVI